MKNVKYYLALPYTKTVRWSVEDELFVARVREIDGVTAHGDTEAGALEMLSDNFEAWIADSLDLGTPVPEPESDDLPSGKFVMRVTRSLHKRLVERAAMEGVSLNHLASQFLAEGIGAINRPAPLQVPELSAASAPVYHQTLILTHEHHTPAGWRSNCNSQDVSRVRTGSTFDDLLAYLPPNLESALLTSSHVKLATSKKGGSHGYETKETSIIN